MRNLAHLAIRNVRRNRRRTLVTLTSIVVGVALLVVMHGFSVGFIEMVESDIVEGRTGAIQIRRAGYAASADLAPIDLTMPDDPALIARVASVPGVRGVAPRIVFSGMVSNGVSQTLFVGRGTRPDAELRACPRGGLELEAGSVPLAVGDYAKALLGSELAASFGVRPGGTVTAQSVSPSGRANAMDLEVVGTTRSAMQTENKRVLTLPLSAAQALVGLPGQVTELVVGLTDRRRLDEVAAALRATLGPSFEVSTWRERQPFVRDLIRRQTFILRGVSLVLSVLVLTGIVNTMLMSVFERVREIGTMLALGVQRRQVLALFLMEASLLGLVGGLGGALLGRGVVGVIALHGVALPITTSSLLRPTLPASFLLVAVALAGAGALVAALYPALRASRMNPVDALRSL